VDGGGSDDVGEFVLSGTYEGLRLVLDKKYIAGTGDAKENKGHTVWLRLTLTELHAVMPAYQSRFGLGEQPPPPGMLGFFGTWHVRTYGYDGDAMMALWRKPPDLGVGGGVGVGVGAVPLAASSKALPIAHGVAVPTFENEGSCGGSMSALRQPLLGALTRPAHRPNEEDRIDELRAAYPGKSTAELRAMAREDRIDELRAAHPGMSTAELLVARARARLT